MLLLLLQRIDCVHNARQAWAEKGAHALDDDDLSIDDLAPSEVKRRIMAYCKLSVMDAPWTTHKHTHTHTHTKCHFIVLPFTHIHAQLG
jgi:hypothetical protein